MSPLLGCLETPLPLLRDDDCDEEEYPGATILGCLGVGEQVIGSKRTHTIAKTIHETVSIVRFLLSFFGVFRLILVNN